MGIVLVGIVVQISEDGLLAPSTLLFFIITGQIIIAGLLHPREVSCLICIVIYYLTVPSMYMLLIIFALFNLHNISWGTRDAKPPVNPNTEIKEEDAEKNGDKMKKDKYSAIKDLIDFILDKLFKCCMYSGESKEEMKINHCIQTLSRIEERLKIIDKKVDDNPESIVECVNSVINEKESVILTMSKSEKDSVLDTKSEEDTLFDKDSSSYRTRIESSCEFDESECSESDSESVSDDRSSLESIKNDTDFTVNPPWIFDDELGKGRVSFIIKKEENFWNDVIEAYLKPIPMDEETRKKNEKVAKDLKDLRNKCIFQFLMINTLYILMIFVMQLNKDKLHIEWPFGSTYNITYNNENPYIIYVEEYSLRLEPIGCVFIVTFFSIIFVQFVSMLFHRFETFSHLLAQTSLDLYCCKKTGLSDKTIVNRYHDIFSKYLLKAYDKMIQGDTIRTKQPPEIRKTILDYTERKESYNMDNFDTLFHEYLDRSDLAEKSGKFNQCVINAMDRHSTLHRTEQREKTSSPIYESAYDLRKSPQNEEIPRKHSSHDNGGFILD